MHRVLFSSMIRLIHRQRIIRLTQIYKWYILAPMTRINCIPPNELIRQHLVAEYRELPRVRHAWPRKTEPNIPSFYCLGKGHVTFFYNKGSWLERRHRELIDEMKRRGYKVNMKPLDLSHWPKHAMKDWEPGEYDKKINRKRINQRIKGGLAR